MAFRGIVEYHFQFLLKNGARSFNFVSRPFPNAHRSLRLRSVQFLASRVRQMSKSSFCSRGWHISAVSYSRHVCRVTQQTCLLRHTTDMSAGSHGRHVCCVTQQTCLPCHTSDMSAVCHSRHVCCVTQQICLLSHVDSWAPVNGGLFEP